MSRRMTLAELIEVAKRYGLTVTSGYRAIDPESPHQVGLDTSGTLRRLGEIDCDGEFIGYICEEGATWQSRRERDAAVGAGRCLDAFMAWNYHGGMLWPEPNYTYICWAAGIKAENYKHAVDEFQRQMWLYEQDRHGRAVLAAMN
jgi:hypothetical protein